MNIMAPSATRQEFSCGHNEVAVAMLLLLGAALLGGCSATAQVQVNPDIRTFAVKTVAILPFEGISAAHETEDHGAWARFNIANSGEMASDFLATELLTVEGFQFIERSQVRKVLEEKGFSVSDLVRQKTASEIGKLMNADAVILGSVSRMESVENVIGGDLPPPTSPPIKLDLRPHEALATGGA